MNHYARSLALFVAAAGGVWAFTSSNAAPVVNPGTVAVATAASAAQMGMTGGDGHHRRSRRGGHHGGGGGGGCGGGGGGGGGPPPCEPDINGDGNVDQKDVSYLSFAVYEGTNPFNVGPTVLDFNHDGVINKDDITDLIDRVAGGPCPGGTDDGDDDDDDDNHCGGGHNWNRCDDDSDRARCFRRSDVNCDGSRDHHDICALTRIIAFRDNPDRINPDINRDGRVDGDDVADIIDVLDPD